MKKSGKGLRSFLTYALSSIIFDVVAFSMSNKLSIFLSANEKIIFLFPILMQSEIIRLVSFGIYYVSNLDISIFTLIILQAMAFLAGIIIHMAFSSRNDRPIGNFTELEES